MATLSGGQRVVFSALNLVAFLSAFPVAGLIAGASAWSGVNWAVAIYLILALFGLLGLLVSIVSAFCRRVFWQWITVASAACLVILALILLAGFLFGRDPSVPISDPITVGGVKGPLIMFYVFALISCSAAGLVAFKRARNRGVNTAASSSS
jgi:hypothetical protein